LRSSTRHPSGGTPPIHIPIFFEAANLIAEALADDLALELCKREQDIEGRASHRRRRVELLRHREKGRVPRIQPNTRTGARLPHYPLADVVIGRFPRRLRHLLAWSGQRTAGPTNAPR
jgi:hypothetical protein